MTHGTLNRVLVITSWLPWPTGGGADLRVEQTVSCLASQLEVGIATLTARPGSKRPAGIRCWESSATRFGDLAAARRDALRWLREPDGHPSDFLWSEEAAATIARALDELDPDVVVLESLLARRAFPLVRAEPRRVVLNAHNNEARLSRALVSKAFGESGPALLTDRLVERTAKVEGALVGAVDQVWACSEREAQQFREDYEGCPPVRVIPNGVEVGTVAAQPDQAKPTLLFAGVLSYPPNQEAALVLAREVLPLVCERVPGARLVLVGTDPSRELLSAAGENASIEVTGAVEEMRPYLERATVVPMPLFSGAGTRYKALEAFAAGVPVVSTAKGIEGLDAQPGQHYLPAETAAEFASAITKLCERADLRAELRTRARQLVESRYSRPVVTERMVAAIADLEPARSGVER